MLPARSRFGEYLRARRSIIKPEDVGLTGSSSRRVVGLRREEVAKLADISPEYYLRLEQGRAKQPSEQVLFSVARALSLDHDASEYLRRLARYAEGPWEAPEQEVPDPVTLSLVRQVRDVGMLLVDTNFDILCANSLAEGMIPGVAESPANLVLELFRSVRPPLEDWDGVAAYLLAVLRYMSSPQDPRLHEIIGALTVHAPEFPDVWARHDVRQPGPITVRAQLDGLGLVTLNCQLLFLPTRRHAVITISGSDTPQGRAEMRYLQVLADETVRISR